MNALQRILCSLEDVRQSKQKLNTQDTVTLLRSLQDLSEEKVLIDRVLQLVLLIKDNEHRISQLSKRQRDIFRLIGLGFSTLEIANLLDLSV